jgi:FkbM family methyltransferase
MANIQSCDTIIALEPDPDTFIRLQQTTRDHPNIQCMNCAATSQYPAATEIVFYKCSTEHTISTINPEWLASETSRFYGEPYTKTVCNAISLDRMIELYGVPDLIKIDVEGGEYDCVCSLTQKVDQLCFEWASEVNHITFQCLDHLQTIGFTQFYVQYGDDYTFRPTETEYFNADITKYILSQTVPKDHWGMMWCK